MKSLALYDPYTGDVYNIIHGRGTVMEGVPSLVVDIPDGYHLETIDISSGTAYPVLKPYSDTPYYKIQAQADSQASTILSISTQVSNHDSNLTSIGTQTNQQATELEEVQLAIAEIYELLSLQEV